MSKTQPERKNTITIAILIISLLINAILLTYIGYKVNYTPKPITGTYCLGEQISPECKYICFEKEGRYVIYKQFELIETGKFQLEDENSYLLTRDSDSVKQWIIYTDNDLIYYNDTDNNTYKLTRIDDIPAYINIENPFK